MLSVQAQTLRLEHATTQWNAGHPGRRCVIRCRTEHGSRKLVVAWTVTSREPKPAQILFSRDIEDGDPRLPPQAVIDFVCSWLDDGSGA